MKRSRLLPGWDSSSLDTWAHASPGGLARVRTMLFDLLSTDSDWIQTAVRVILGVIFFAHGAQKLLGWFGGPGLSVSLRGMRESFGVPAPLALLVIATEFL